MSAARRQDLLDWAAETGATILEDYFDHDFHDGPAPLSLASMDCDHRVIYIGSFSKLALPGLRPGSRPAFLSASTAATGRWRRSVADPNGDDALERGRRSDRECKLRQKVAKMLDLYRERRDTLASLLRESFDDTLRTHVPARGAAVWIATEPPVNKQVWSTAAAQAGVLTASQSSSGVIEENASRTPRQDLARTCPVRMQWTHAS